MRENWKTNFGVRVSLSAFLQVLRDLTPHPAVIFHFYDAGQDGFITKDELLLISVPLHRFCFGAGSESRQAQQVTSALFFENN